MADLRYHIRIDKLDLARCAVFIQCGHQRRDNVFPGYIISVVWKLGSARFLHRVIDCHETGFRQVVVQQIRFVQKLTHLLGISYPN